jgi:hypothetical protein
MKLEPAIASALLALSCCAYADVHFTEVTEDAGIVTTPTWKYGTVTLADLNGDGYMDLVLGNHHEYPAQLFLSSGKGVWQESDPVMQGDVHGIAAGDYDNDGRTDLVVAVGGGNGTNPQPPRLLYNTGNGFVDRTEAAGIANMGARGRSVRWIDPDLDGDLDLLQINARQLPGESGPRNILFENQGDGTFRYRPSPTIEPVEAERVLVTDINGDRIADLVTFTPLGVFLGDSEFQYTDASAQWLAKLSDEQREHAMAVAEADIDNDGDMDLYVARGKTYYEIANNSLDFDPETGRMDLRDEGNEGQDYVDFYAGNVVGLQDFWHWYRGKDLSMPVYAGARQNRLPTPTSPMLVTAAVARGMPDQLDKNGWYLGYLGEGKWQLAWKLDGDLAWGIRASVTGVSKVEPHWKPQERGVPDLLLINQGDHFDNASNALPEEAGDNNWGVITADFDNDSRSDFFIYRFGHLHGRVEDVLLLNASHSKDPSFTAQTDHGANNLKDDGHGDMGAPLDLDQDGWMDILSGTDNPGRWHLYRNTSGDSGNKNHWLTVHVGHSPSGADALGAEIYLTAGGQNQFKRVGSRGTVHSQSLNDWVHFGLGDESQAVEIRVRWRDGTQQIEKSLGADKIYSFGK